MARNRGATKLDIAEPFTIKIRVRGRVVALRLSPDISEGGYVVGSPTLRGLNTQGDSIEEAIGNGKEAALALLTESRRRSHAQTSS